MANYANYLTKKAELKFNAANQKPERPRFGDEVSLDKALFDMQQQMSQPDKEIESQKFNELDQNWKSGGGGSRGDALISGLKAGIKKGSLLDDKKRYQKFMTGVEKLKTMVEDTNRELYKQEKIYNATESIMPRLMSFMKTQKNMDPNAKRVFLQNTLDEYNQAAGTDYKLLGYDGVEPWKVTLSDSERSQFLDLMSLMKTPAQHKYEMYIENSPEMRQAEGLLQQEDALDKQYKQSQINKNNAKAGITGNETMLQTEHGNLDISAMPTIQTAKERNIYSQTYAGMAKVMRELTDTYNEVLELENMTQGNVFSPFGSQVGEFPNKVKDWVAKNPNADKDTAKEVELRNKIESRFQQIQPVIERYLKGAAPDSQLLKRMHEKGVYPESNQSFQIIKSKLEMLMNTAKEDMDIAGMSLKTGRQIPFLPKKNSNINNQQTFNQATQEAVFKLPKGANISPEELEILKMDGIKVTQ